MKKFNIWLVAVFFACTLVTACSTTTVNLSTSHENTLVVVTGITGNQGGGVADALLPMGFKVRGVSRNIDSDASKALSSRGVEMVQADYTDYDSMTAAVQGADRLFINITEQTPNFIDAAKHTIDAAYAAGVQHIVFTSNRPADPESGFDVNSDRTKRQIELHLRASGGSYTTLRIPFMMENLMRERDWGRLFNDGVIDYGEEGNYGYYMSSEDMGLLAAAAFADPEAWNGREVNMATDALTYRELADLLSELSGTEVPYRVAPWSEMRGPFVPNFQWFEQGNPDYDLEEIREEFPSVKTVREFLIDNEFGEKIRAFQANN